MSRPAQTADVERASLQRLTRGLRMVTVPFPHLTGLAAAVRVAVDDSVPTMGVFASGRLVANSRFTARLSNDDLVFVLAHELLHLALRTHDRAVGSGRLEFNYAHDYIINDMLRHALGLGVIPAGGLDMAGARERSAEEIVLEMRRNQSNSSRSRVWEGQIVSIEQVLNSARQGQAGDMGDVLDADRERAMFPDDVADQMERARAIRDLAAKGMALGKALGLMKGRGTEAGGSQRQVRALRGIYRTPWQVALQRWLEGVSPGERTFTRASRRGADRADLVLPGRQRYSMMLHVVLDTSGSMSDEIPYALGAIADLCRGGAYCVLLQLWRLLAAWNLPQDNAGLGLRFRSERAQGADQPGVVVPVGSTDCVGQADSHRLPRADHRTEHELPDADAGALRQPAADHRNAGSHDAGARRHA